MYDYRDGEIIFPADMPSMRITDMDAFTRSIMEAHAVLDWAEQEQERNVEHAERAKSVERGFGPTVSSLSREEQIAQLEEKES